MNRPWSSILRKTFVLALCLAPAIYGFYVMTKHWVPVPYWDEWDSPGRQLASYYRGTLSWADLFSQHNESRSFFPRLLYLPLAIAFGWDVRNQMALTFACACAASLGLYLILRKTNPSSRAIPFVFAAMNFLLFSPRQYENFLDGLMGEAFTPAVALIFALRMNLTPRSFKTKALVNATLAFVANYTFANGMLVWLLGFPIPTAGLPETDDRRRNVWRLVYIVAAVASIALYFSTYRHPPLAPPFVSPLARLSELAGFVLVWIGSVFSVGAPLLCGGVVLFVFVGLALIAIGQMRRSKDWRPHYPWLVLGSYTLISGSVVALGRLGFAYSMAGDARYTASSVFLYIAVAGLGFSVATHAKTRPIAIPLSRSAAAVAVALLVVAWSITFRKERRIWRLLSRAREHSLLVLRWSEAIPKNPEVRLLSPYPVDETARTIRTLAENDALRPRLVTQGLANAVNEIPNTADSSAGALEQVISEANGQLRCRGWARLPDSNRRADCVVIGVETDGVWQPYCVIETGQKRPDLVPQLAAGFSGSVPDAKTLPPNAIVRAWAIDLEKERAFPMAGALKLQPPHS